MDEIGEHGGREREIFNFREAEVVAGKQHLQSIDSRARFAFVFCRPASATPPVSRPSVPQLALLGSFYF